MEQQSPKCFIIAGRWLERGEERRLRSPRVLTAVPKPRWMQGLALVGMVGDGPWHGMHPEGRTGGKPGAVVDTCCLIILGATATALHVGVMDV